MFLSDKATNAYYDEIIAGIDYHDEIASNLFDECTFNECNFDYTSFKHCKFKHCRFINCKLNFIELKSSYFLNTYFEKCDIVGVNWAYAEISLHQNLKFLSCNISKSSFLGLKLSAMSIIECIARETDFRNCDLSKSILTGCDFQNALFSSTDLTSADLNYSSNYYISVFDNKIKGAKFSLPEAISLLTCMGIIID